MTTFCTDGDRVFAFDGDSVFTVVDDYWSKIEGTPVTLSKFVPDLEDLPEDKLPIPFKAPVGKVKG